mmetsp:Transcript_75332/g.140470  ORF Transcript_75332/g.140470 Transcript_75332/m.140470 type:complete len:294 (-) Transcript_75332:35-916(-)
MANIHARYQAGFNAVEYEDDDEPWPMLGERVLSQALQKLETLTAGIDRRTPTYEQMIHLAFGSIAVRASECNLVKLIAAHDGDAHRAATYMLQTWRYLLSAVDRLLTRPVQVEVAEDRTFLAYFHKASEFVVQQYRLAPRAGWTWHPEPTAEDREMDRIEDSMRQTHLLLCANLPTAGLCMVHFCDDADLVRAVALDWDAVQAVAGPLEDLPDPVNHSFERQGRRHRLYHLLMHECVHLLWRIRNRREVFSPDRVSTHRLENNSGYCFEQQVLGLATAFDPLGLQRLPQDEWR